MPDNGDLKRQEPIGHVIDLRRLFMAVWENILIILSAALLVSVLLAAKCAYEEKPKYRSTFSIMIGNKTTEQEVSSVSTADISAANQLANVYSATMKSSQYFIDNVIEKAGLTGVCTYSQVKGAISADAGAQAQQLALTVTMTNAEQCIRIAQGMSEVIPILMPELVRGSSVRVVSSPLQSVSRTTADVKGSAKKGFLLGLIAMAALVILLDLIDRRVKSVRELERIVGETGIVCVPTVKAGKDGKVPYGDASGAFAALRAQLKSGISGEGKIIGITSAEEGEGKTFTALGLALSCAKAGKKTLCLEADFRNPCIGKITGLPEGPGLADAVSGEDVRPEETAVLSQNISVLAAGTAPDDPTVVLESGGMRRLMDKFRSEYDVVIMDLPGAAAYPDAMIASDYADSFVYVVRNRKSDIRKIKQTIRQLETTGKRIAGFIYNDTGALKL